MTVSVIIPYIEGNELLANTLKSIYEQKNIASNNVEIVIVDTTEGASSEIVAAAYSSCKVLKRPDITCEADAFNFALGELSGTYAVFCRCGDVFSNLFFTRNISALDSNPELPFAVSNRFCINPIYKDRRACRTNFAKSLLDTVIKLELNFDLVEIEIDGVFFRTEVLKRYPANNALKYEYFNDLMLRVQMDCGSFFVTGSDAEYNCFMPLSDDSAYFVPSNHIEWYKQSYDEFLFPLIDSCQKRFNSLPMFVQYFLMYEVSARFQANMNNRNKRNMDEEQLNEFLEACKKVLGYIDNTIVFNTRKSKSLGISEEAAEMFYMLKCGKTLGTMPFNYIQGKNDILLDCESVLVSRLSSQRVGLHVLDYRNGKLTVDGSFRRVFNLDDIELYAIFNNQRISLVNTDRYSLTKYFGISAYKKFTFRLELEIDDSIPVNRLAFYAFYKSTVIPLSMSFLHHWAKFSGSPKNGYWRFNKYIAKLGGNKEILITKSSALDTFKSELKYLSCVFPQSKRLFITRIEYWLTRPFYKNKKIWLMYDKMYKGGDSCEYLYRFCADKKDGITRYYIIDKNTSDYRSLKKAGLKPVKNRSFKHKMIFLNTDIALITNSNCFPFNGYSMDKSRFIRGLCNFPTMCLQHGLSVQKCAMAQQRVVDNTQMYFLASSHEYENLMNHAYNYQDFDILKMTGIGRYDGLINNDQKQILISPTWRMYNAMPVTTSEGEQRSYNPEFKTTVYYRIYNDLINNQKLIETAKRTGYKIKYLLHPILSAQVDDYTPDPYVDVISSVGDLSYEEILTKSSLMVTDYSGVQFDFAYMKKPLVYFHPDELPAHYEDGGFFYDTMGFGEICTTSEMLVDTLCEYMENGCQMKPEYVDRVEKFYEFDDHNNCQRIYDCIMEYQKQVNIDKLKK